MSAANRLWRITALLTVAEDQQPAYLAKAALDALRELDFFRFSEVTTHRVSSGHDSKVTYRISCNAIAPGECDERLVRSGATEALQASTSWLPRGVSVEETFDSQAIEEALATIVEPEEPAIGPLGPPLLLWKLLGESNPAEPLSDSAKPSPRTVTRDEARAIASQYLLREPTGADRTISEVVAWHEITHRRPIDLQRASWT